MIYLMSPEEVVMIAVAAIVPVAIACVAWRNRFMRPIAARLFIAAVICLLIPVGITAAEGLLGVDDVFDLWESGESNSQIALMNIEGQLHPGSPGWQRMIAEQMIHSSFSILAWSLMAWAILMQPDKSHVGNRQARLINSPR